MSLRDNAERDWNFKNRRAYGSRHAIAPDDLVRLDDLEAAIAAIPPGAGASYTFTDGLTLDIDGHTVHGDYITGHAGGNTWSGGLNPGDGLTIDASKDAAKGPMRFNASGWGFNADAVAPTMVDVDLTQSFAQTDVTTDFFKIHGSVDFTADQNYNTADHVAYVSIYSPTFNNVEGDNDLTPNGQQGPVATLWIEGEPSLAGWDDTSDSWAIWAGGAVSFRGNAFLGGQFNFLDGLFDQTIYKSGTGDFFLQNINGGNTFLGTNGGTGAVSVNAAGALGVNVLPSGAHRFQVHAAQSVAFSSSATLDAVYFDPSTTTLTGGTGTISTAAGFNQVVFAAPTINATSTTINNAATVTILGAPSGTATITNPYALNVQAGTTRLAGTVIISTLTGMLKATSGTVSVGTGGTDYVAPTTTLTAGTGLTGGGDLSANRTFNVGANADGSIAVNADDIQVGVLATDAQHGNRGNGSLHTTATTSTAGFLAAADKSTLANSKFFVGNSTNAPASAQNLGALASGILKQTVSGGVSTISVATGGTDFENPLTFSQGVTRASNAVTGDYITGKAGGQVWTSGTSASDPLTIQTFATSPTGAITLKAAQIFVPAGNFSTAPGIEFTGSTGAGFAYQNASGTDLLRVVVNESTLLYFQSDGIHMNNGALIDYGQGSSTKGVGIGGYASGGPYLDVVGTTATTAQGFSVFNTRTDGSNYERYTIDWTTTANTVKVGAQAAGTGTVRAVSYVGASHTFGNTVVIQSLTGMLKATSGTVSVGTAGTDYTGIITLTAGTGLTGGGDTSASRTFNVIGNADGSILANPDDIQVGVLATDAQHGNRGGGGIHAAATTGTAGFLSSADKSTLANSKFFVGNSTNAPASSQNLGALTTGILKQTVSAGVSTIATATGGTDYEFPLTFSIGLTRATNTITANITTGVSGGQTATGGTVSGNALTLRSNTSNDGKILLGSTSNGFSESTGQFWLGTTTPASTATIAINVSQNSFTEVLNTNANTGGAAGAWFVAGLNANTDSGKTMVMAMLGTNWTTSGLLGPQVGLIEHAPSIASNMVISANSTGDMVFATTTSRTERARVTTDGYWTHKLWGTAITTSPSNRYGFELQQAATTNISNGVTGTIWATAAITQGTFQMSSGSATITSLASLYIDGAPLNGGGGLTTTNRYSIFCDFGLARFDGDGTQVFETPHFTPAPTSFSNSNEYIPVKVTGVGLKYILLQDLSFS
jgi:hypothetical protein